MHNVSFEVKNGEFFGPLVVNGAVKTFMFRLLTGQVSVCAGDVFINNKRFFSRKFRMKFVSVKSKKNEILSTFLSLIYKEMFS